MDIMADELWSVLLHWDGECTTFKCTIPLLCNMTSGIVVNAVFHFLSSSRYTGCNRRNGPDFGRVFLMLNYTEKTPKHLYPKLNGLGDNGQ